MQKRNPIPGYHPLRKLKVILQGLRIAVILDFSVAYKLLLSIPILLSAVSFHQWLDLTLTLLATSIMLVAELLNSAIELICDFIEPQDNPAIGVIKDIAAAAAGVSILVWAITLILEGIQLWQVHRN
jgi:diacylglycerol kinase